MKVKAKTIPPEATITIEISKSEMTAIVASMGHYYEWLTTKCTITSHPFTQQLYQQLINAEESL